MNENNKTKNVFQVQFITDTIPVQETLYIMNFRDTANSTIILSEIFCYDRNNQMRKIAGTDDLPYGIINVLPSPDSKYLAFEIVGEGHVWSEIIDLQKFISEGEYQISKEIFPYPGNLSLLHWQNNQLILECDIDLTLKNQNKELGLDNINDTLQVYSFDMQSGLFKKL
jgi:hypothetical protein